MMCGVGWCCIDDGVGLGFVDMSVMWLFEYGGFDGGLVVVYDFFINVSFIGLLWVLW